MNVAEHLVDLLRRQGTEHLFGVPSGDWLPYMEAMEQGGVDFVLVSNEASAGFMAAVYGWLKRAPGACYGTLGPGATNLSTGIGSALLDRSPVLAFTSEPSDEMMGRTTQMAVDHQMLMRPLTKWTTRLQPERAEEILGKAVRIATAEYPGPVHIGLPGGTGEQKASPADLPPAAAALPGGADEAVLKEMKRRFSAARKPLIAAGMGALRLGLGPLVARVAERHGIPVVLSPMAKGLIAEEHPSYAGVLFHALSDRVAETHREADLVLGVGYDPVEFNYEQWMPEVPLLHLDSAAAADIDPLRYPEVLDVIGHPAAALAALAEAEALRSAWDLTAIARRRERMLADLRPGNGSFGPTAVLEELRAALPENGIMTCDVGSHTHLIGQAWWTPGPYRQLMTNGWSSMGFGVPAALGAKIAEPQTAVACVTGDGGFLMMAGEMATAKRLGMPIVFVVLVDHSLELIRLKQDRRGRVTDHTVLCCSDTPAVDSIFGVPVVRAADRESLRQALRQGFSADGPTLIEAKIDAAEYKELIMKKHR
jgi:acetolactate synthase-1/2/3 large subunit